MLKITVSEKDYNENNLYYVQESVSDILNGTGSRYSLTKSGSRSVLKVECPEGYAETLCAEIADKVAEVIAINYKYAFFKENVKTGGLSETEKEILLAGIIAADLEDDKKYAFDRIKGNADVAVDGVYNFRMQPLKKKWAEIISYIPTGFPNSGLKEFIGFLLENKKKRIYVDGGKVYDSHYRRLKRSNLLGGGELAVLKEVLLSNCGEIELSGKISEEDEKYLKEFYGDRIFFSAGYSV